MTLLPELLQSTRTFDGVLLLQHEAVATIPSSSSTSYDDLKRNNVDNHRPRTTLRNVDD